MARARWHLLPEQQSVEAVQPNLTGAMHCSQGGQGAGKHRLSRQEKAAFSSGTAGCAIQRSGNSRRWALTLLQLPAAEALASFWQNSAVSPGQQLPWLTHGPSALEHLRARGRQHSPQLSGLLPGRCCSRATVQHPASSTPQPCKAARARSRAGLAAL